MKHKKEEAMKKSDFWFLLRFLIISIIYLLEYILLGYDFLTINIIFYPLFFALVLLAYLILIIFSFFVDEKRSCKIKKISDIVFLSLFGIQTLKLLVSISGDIGAGGLAFIGMMLYFPMLICFIIWFNRDRKRENLFKS